MHKPDICITEKNCIDVVSHLLKGVSTICNKKRATKKSETYLYCGAGYDTESTTIMQGDKPTAAFVYHVQISINGQYMYFRDLNILPLFIDSLVYEVQKYRDKKIQPKLIIWVANLSHEWAFFKHQLAEVGISSIFAKNEREPLKITIRDCIEFRECIGLFGDSLSHIAETYTNTQKLKGDLDYSLIRTPHTTLDNNEYSYCKNDVVILDELSYIAFDKFTKQGLKIPMTKTGILRQKCKNAIHKIQCEYAVNEKLMPETEKEYYMQRRYMYSGGLSGTNTRYINKFIKHTRCADITSDYPAQINHHLYPSGELVEIEPTELNKYKHLFRIILFTADFAAKTSHAIISKEKIINFKGCDDCPFTTMPTGCIISNGKLLFGDNICMMLNNIDIAAYSQVYHITNIKVYKAYIFTDKARAPYFLRKCMNDDYLIKADLKERGLQGTREYTESKIVNAYYGMCATRLYENECVYDDKKGDIKEEKSSKSYDDLRKKMWLSPYIAYWCTSYARALLIKFIAKYPDLIVQYDTDSLYFITDTDIVSADRIHAFLNDLHEYNKKIGNKNNRLFKNNKHFYDLGAWDIDKEDSIGFKGLGAKRYIIQKADGSIKPVVAGMVKSSFAEHLKRTGETPFEAFRDDMTVSKIISKKLASKYFDGYKDNNDHFISVTDYQNNTELVRIDTYHALFPIAFNMKVAGTLLYIAELLRQEKALPEKYRQLEKIIHEVI